VSVERATLGGPRILVLGRPGSGKGTQCGRLADRLGVPHIATGDLFRDTVSADTALGRVLREYMDAGEFVPDELVIDVVDDRLGPDGAAAGFVLDGFPRTVPQAEQLEELLAPYAVDLAINLVVPAEIARARLTRRVVCADCGRTAGSRGGLESVVCEDCGGPLTVREDDDRSTVGRRLALYDERTAPLVEWLERRDLLTAVDGVGAPDEVAARIDAASSVLVVADDLAS
jgi:adenylate kinase